MFVYHQHADGQQLVLHALGSSIRDGVLTLVAPPPFGATAARLRRGLLPGAPPAVRATALRECRVLCRVGVRNCALLLGYVFLFFSFLFFSFLFFSFLFYSILFFRV